MITDFKIDHLKQMDLSNSRDVLGVDFLERYKDVNGPAKTLIIDDKVIGCGGIETLWNGVGEAWLLLSDHVFDHRVTLVLNCRRMFSDMVRDYHRVQALALASFYLGVKFAEFMGFEHEGLAFRYGPNKEDYYRFVILR